MPFQETCAVEERIAMLRDYDMGVFAVSELCRRYGVSRETFYVWKRRRESGAAGWFGEGSHAPETCPHRTGEEIADAIVAERERFAHFGPKKIRARLIAARPDIRWPAASTMGDILKAAGLVAPRRRRRRPIATTEIAPVPLAANAEWAIDFKGWFRTRDGKRCDPLTVTDAASRYAIEARIVEPTWAGVRRALERVFADLGLPGAIRSDNGSPFGSTGAGGLSSLAVWWLRLGIEPHYIRPASPQDNGRHERFHRTLKDATSRPPAASACAQQARFDAFRRHYNQERPHEALGQCVPASHWTAPARRLPRRLEDPWYDADHEVRRIRPQGDMKWRGEHVFVGEAFAGELVGIAELEDGRHIVRFCHRDLGVIERDCRFLRFAPPRARLRAAPEAEADEGTQSE